MGTFDAIARDMYQASPDMVLKYLHEKMPDLASELSRFVAGWEHGDANAIVNTLAIPLVRRKWPTEPDDELIWFLSETMTGAFKNGTTSGAFGNDVSGFLEMYLACLLLHYEALRGEAAIPQAPICTAIIINHVLASDDGVYSGMVLRFLLNTYIHRKTPFDDSVFPCPEMAILILMLSMCESLSDTIGRGVENGSLPWLWSMYGKLSQDVSLVAWLELVKECRNRYPTHEFFDVIQRAISE